MFQIRLHGRGGQGVVTAAEMLSLAAFMEGHFAQAFPSFGSERTGAPVTAFARFSDHEIRLHEPIEEPDVVLVQDRTLIDSVDVFSGLNPEGYVLVNSASSPEEIGLGELVKRLPAGHVKTVPATDLALKFIGRPLPGAAMLAGFAAMTGMLKLESINSAYGQKYSGKVAQMSRAGPGTLSRMEEKNNAEAAGRFAGRRAGCGPVPPQYRLRLSDFPPDPYR